MKGRTAQLIVFRLISFFAATTTTDLWMSLAILIETVTDILLACTLLWTNTPTQFWIIRYIHVLLCRVVFYTLQGIVPIVCLLASFFLVFACLYVYILKSLYKDDTEWEMRDSHKVILCSRTSPVRIWSAHSKNRGRSRQLSTTWHAVKTCFRSKKESIRFWRLLTLASTV